MGSNGQPVLVMSCSDKPSLIVGDPKTSLMQSSCQLQLSVKSWTLSKRSGLCLSARETVEKYRIRCPFPAVEKNNLPPFISKRSTHFSTFLRHSATVTIHSNAGPQPNLCCVRFFHKAALPFISLSSFFRFFFFLFFSFFLLLLAIGIY